MRRIRFDWLTLGQFAFAVLGSCWAGCAIGDIDDAGNGRGDVARIERARAGDARADDTLDSSSVADVVVGRSDVVASTDTRLDVLGANDARGDVPVVIDARTDVPLVTDTRPDVPIVPTGDCVRTGPWMTTAPFADSSHHAHPLPSFAVGSWYYVHTCNGSCDGDRILYSARQNADGSLGSWQVASTDHGGGPHGFMAMNVAGTPFMFRNGHIARYVLTADGRMTGDVVLQESSMVSSFGGNMYVWDSAVFGALPGGDRFVYHLGGFSFVGHTYAADTFQSRVPIGSSFTRVGRHPSGERAGHGAFVVASGGRSFIYTGEGDGPRMWRSEVTAGPSFGAWTPLANLPAGTDNNHGDWFSVDRTLFVVRGRAVFAAHVRADGGLDAFVRQADLPAAEVEITWGGNHLEGAASGVIGSYAYVTGTRNVYYSRLDRGAACP